MPDTSADLIKTANANAMAAGCQLPVVQKNGLRKR